MTTIFTFQYKQIIQFNIGLFEPFLLIIFSTEEIVVVVYRANWQHTESDFSCNGDKNLELFQNLYTDADFVCLTLVFNSKIPTSFGDNCSTIRAYFRSPLWSLHLLIECEHSGARSYKRESLYTVWNGLFNCPSLNFCEQLG